MKISSSSESSLQNLNLKFSPKPATNFKNEFIIQQIILILDLVITQSSDFKWHNYVPKSA